MPSLTVFVADKGARYVTPKGEVYTSSTGHMWIELQDANGKKYSFGFAPEDQSGSIKNAISTGMAYDTDSRSYVDIFSKNKIEISQAQFDIMFAFGNKSLNAKPGSTITGLDIFGKSQDFSLRYNGVFNSCIDYAWKLLEVGGINRSGFEGALWPASNTPFIENSLRYYQENKILLLLPQLFNFDVAMNTWRHESGNDSLWNDYTMCVDISVKQ